MRFPHTFLPVGQPDGSYQPMKCCHCGKGYITGSEAAPVENCPAFDVKESDQKQEGIHLALERVRELLRGYEFPPHKLGEWDADKLDGLNEEALAAVSQDIGGRKVISSLLESISEIEKELTDPLEGTE